MLERGFFSILLLVGAAALGGCATGAQQEAERMQGTGAVSLQAMNACWATVEASDQYQALKGRLPPPQGDTPMAIMVNQAKPTPEEAALLLSLHDGPIAACHREGIEDAGKVHPAYGAIFARGYADADTDYAQLVQRQISWGEYAQRSARRKEVVRTAMLEADAQIRQNLQSAHAYEMQQRQAFAAAMRQAAYQQQVISALNRPVTTNCYRNGAYLNCTSQ